MKVWKKRISLKYLKPRRLTTGGKYLQYIMIIKYQLYNNTVELVFDSLRHRYTVNGELVPSVTAILSVISKPALIYWASNMAVDYIAEQIKPGQSYDELELEDIWTNSRKAHTQKKKKAGDIGSFVHKYVENYIHNRQPSMPINEGIRLSSMKFLEWEAKNQVKFLCSEQPIYSKKYNYAGTLDFICKIGGKLYLGDLKTSGNIYSEYKMQTAAYLAARTEEFPEEKYNGILIVRIGKEGDFEFFIEEDMEKIKSWQQGFFSAVQLKKVMDSLEPRYV